MSRSATSGTPTRSASDKEYQTNALIGASDGIPFNPPARFQVEGKS